MSLIGWWKLNGDSKDYSGNGNDGAMTGGTINTTPYGMFGPTYDFIGGSYYNLDCGYISDKLMLEKDLTICFRIFLKSYPAGRFGIMQTAYGAEFALNITSTGAIQYYYGTSGDQALPYTNIQYGGPVPLNTWLNVVITRRVTDTLSYFDYYIDGTKVSSQSSTYIPVKATSRTLKLGYSHTGTLDGYLQDVRLYDEVLPEHQIKEYSQAKFIHYKFNEPDSVTNLLPNTDVQADLSYWALNTSGGSGTVSRVWDNELECWCVDLDVTSTGTFTFLENDLSTFMPGIPRFDLASDYTLQLKAKRISGTADNLLVKISDRDSLNRSFLVDRATTSLLSTWSDFTVTAKPSNDGSSTPVLFITPWDDTLNNYTTSKIRIAKCMLTKSSEVQKYTPDFSTKTITNQALFGYDLVPAARGREPLFSKGSGKYGEGTFEYTGKQADSSDNVNRSFNTLDKLPNLTQLTVSAWVYPRESHGMQVCRGLANTFIMHCYGAGFYLTYEDGTTSGYLNGFSNVTLNTWSLLTATWDGTTMRTYVNGVETGSQSATGGSTGRLYSSVLSIGRYFNTVQSAFNGFIDDVCIYATALDTQSIKELYTSGMSIYSTKEFATRGEIVEPEVRNLYAGFELDSEYQGTNLITDPHFNNGISQFENYAALTWDTSDGSSSLGCIRATGPVYFKSSDLIPIDTSRRFYLDCMAKSVGIGNSWLYFGLDTYDEKYRHVGQFETVHIENTRTTLTQDLNDGDTVVHLADLTNWTDDGVTYHSAVGFWFTDSTLNDYPLWTRTTLVSIHIINVDKVNKTLTLQTPWNKGFVPAGSHAANMWITGGTYQYFAAGRASVPTTWTNYSAVIEGEQDVFTTPWNGDTHMFRYSTKYVKLLFLANYQQDTSYISLFDDVRLICLNGHQEHTKLLSGFTKNCVVEPSIDELGPTDGMVRYMPFDGSYEDLTSAEIKPATVTMVGGTYTNGLSNKKCLELSGGANSRVQVVDTTGSTGTAGAISVWANVIGTTTTYDYIVGDTANVRTYIAISNGSSVQFTKGTPAVSSTLQPFTLGTWHHYVLTWDSGVFDAYIDGVKVVDALAFSDTTDSYKYCIGDHGSASGQSPHLKVQDFRMFNKRLSQSEVTKLYKVNSAVFNTAASLNKDNTLTVREINEVK